MGQLNMKTKAFFIVHIYFHLEYLIIFSLGAKLEFITRSESYYFISKRKQIINQLWDVLGIDYFGLSFWFNGVLMFYGKPICVCHAFNFNDTLTLHFYKLITHER